MVPGSVFGSTAISHVFGVLGLQPQDSMRQREIERALDKRWPIASVQQALQQLVKRGLVEEVYRGSTTEYRPVRTNPSFWPSLRIALVESGLGEAFALFHVSAVVAFGSLVRDALTDASDIDLLVIGGIIDDSQAADVVRPFAQRFGRQVDVSLMDGFEYLRRRAADDPYLLGAIEEGITIYGGLPA